MAIIAIPTSDGQFELEGFSDIVWDNVSPIVEKPVFGNPYFNPNTGRNSTLVGQTEYENITAEALLDAEIKRRFDAFRVTWKNRTAGITATHILGGVITHLTGVRFAGLSYGQIDKLSNDASKMTLTVTFEGIRAG